MKNFNKKNSKVRHRSKMDLKFRKKGFLEIADFLKRKKIDFFLTSGVLLGFKREKNFISWDWDVEFDFHESTFLDNLEVIMKYLKDNKFTLIYKNINSRKLEYAKYRPASTTTFTLRAWKYDYISKNYIRNRLSIPKKYFHNMTKIKFANRYFNCPGPILDYLDYFYGDWKTPIRTSDKNIYLSKNIYKVNLGKYYLFFNILKSKIIKFLGC